MSIDRLTLRTRLLLTVLLPVLLLSGAMTGVSLFRGARMADQEITERGLAIVSFLAPAAEYGVISGSRGSLDGLIQALQVQSDVAAAVLYGLGGDELVRLGAPALDDDARTRQTGEAVRLGRQGRRVAFAAPVMSVPVAVNEFAGGEAVLAPFPVGWVYVELDTHAYDTRRRETVMTTVGLAVGALALAMLLAIHLANVVGAPVARLVEAVRRMARGELDVQVTGRAGSEELQALEDGFNSMARSIANAHKTLQARIEQATAHLPPGPARPAHVLAQPPCIRAGAGGTALGLAPGWRSRGLVLHGPRPLQAGQRPWRARRRRRPAARGCRSDPQPPA